jgi:hypothetical protein
LEGCWGVQVGDACNAVDWKGNGNQIQESLKQVDWKEDKKELNKVDWKGVELRSRMI